MPRTEIPLGRDPKFLAKNLTFTAVFLAFAVYKGSMGSFEYMMFWTFCACVALFYTTVSTSGRCPGCAGTLTLDAGLSQFLRCPKCGTYVEVEKGKLWTVDAERVTPRPVFAAVIGGPNDAALNPAGISLAKQPVMDGGERRLDFRFPEGCCVCGKRQTDRDEARLDAVGKGARALGFADERLVFVVPGIPRCVDHPDGAALDIENVKLVLKFRSLSYRDAFRTLNSLP